MALFENVRRIHFELAGIALVAGVLGCGSSPNKGHGDSGQPRDLGSFLVDQAEPYDAAHPDHDSAAPDLKMATCTEITLGTFTVSNADGTYGDYVATISPDTGDVTDPDQASVQFYGPGFGSYDGDKTGSFDLTQNGDDNYATCSRCIVVYADPDVPGKIFYQSSGTLDVDPSSDQLNGTVTATLTDVTLVEVTIDSNTFASTPVPGGACLHIASAQVNAVSTSMVPAAWTCDPTYYGDGSCDCGCGAADSDCADATSASCVYCSDPGSCNLTSGCPGTISATDNTTCMNTPPAGWTCDTGYWADGTCDCGCATPDPDCADATSASCERCDDTGTCNLVSGCPGTISATDNTTCMNTPPAAWTCSTAYWADGTMCDCGCGTPDPDCADATSTSCARCNDTGGCNTTDCADAMSTIAPADNATCLPAAWACDPGYYGDGSCDCGCAAADVDCADATVTSCDFCGDPGSCSTDVGCPGMISATDNTTCGP